MWPDIAFDSRDACYGPILLRRVHSIHHKRNSWLDGGRNAAGITVVGGEWCVERTLPDLVSGKNCRVFLHFTGAWQGWPLLRY